MGFDEGLICCLPKEHLDVLPSVTSSFFLHPFPLHHYIVEETPVYSSCRVIKWYQRAWIKYLVLGGGRGGMMKGELRTFHLQRETADPRLAIHSFPI